MYLGLYHSIVRNSIPVFVDNAYYESKVKSLFKADDQYAIEARVRGRLEPLNGNFIKEFIEENHLQGLIRPEILRTAERPVLALIVDGGDTGIEYRAPARYLDGDIWVAVESNGEQFFISRFLDLADPEDVRQEFLALRKDVEQYFPDSTVVFQCDQVEKVFSGHATTDVESLIERFTRRGSDTPE